MKKIYLFLSLIYFMNCFAQSNLYEGEQIASFNGFQTLFKFVEGDASKPLVIFIPGEANLARISYGFPGGKDDDFLSYWFHKKGYPFLGVSYPTDNKVFTKISPSFTVRDWGNQVATLVKNIIDQNRLSSHVVVLAWGMAGNIEEAVEEAFNKNRVLCDEFIGLSAMSPLSNLVPTKGKDNNPILPNLMVDKKPLLNWFLNLVEEQNKFNGREIIPAKIYTEDFFGNFPVALEAKGYFLNGNKFEYNLQKTIEDTGVFNFNNTPWLGFLNDNSSSAAKVAIFDTNAWDYIRSEMIYSQYVYYINIAENQNKFLTIKRIMSQIPQHFSDTVGGNYLFFLGKKGALVTVEKVDLLLQRMNATKKNIIKLALN